MSLSNNEISPEHDASPERLEETAAEAQPTIDSSAEVVPLKEAENDGTQATPDDLEPSSQRTEPTKSDESSDVGHTESRTGVAVGENMEEKTEGAAVTQEHRPTSTAESDHEAEGGSVPVAGDALAAQGQGDSSAANRGPEEGTAMERMDSSNDGIPTREGSQLEKDEVTTEPADASRPDTPIDLRDLRAASPASNASGSTTGIARASSTTPGITSTAPKKFSSMNINKKFLGKTAVAAPTATAPNFGGLGMKPGLGSLGVRPSPSPSSQTSSSRMLTSVKLTKTSSTSASPVSSSVTPPPLGWNRPGVDTAGKGKLAADGQIDAPVTGLSSLKRPLGSGGGLQQGPLGVGMGVLSSKKKKGWGSVPEPGRAAPVLPGSSKEFPTAREVIEGQKAAALHAQLAAQAQAAHHTALLQGLDSFRSRKRDDPNAHYWDEDDEDGNFDQVLDFGDGTTYTIPAAAPAAEQPLEPDQTQDEPVTKDQRFVEDFDRSWPPRAQEPPRDTASSRVLFNERSNKLEVPADRAKKLQPMPPQLLRRGSRESEQPSGRPPPGRPQVGFDRPLPPHLSAPLKQGPPPQGPSLSRREPPPHLGGDVERPSAPSVPAQPQQRLPLGALARRGSSSTPGTRPPPPLQPTSTVAEEDWRSGPAQSQSSGQAALDIQPPQRQSILSTPASAGASWRNDALAFNRPSGSTASSQLPPPPELPQPSPVEVPVPAAAAPPTNITDMQKDEMHSAAERAKARREAEEAEREAQKERARRKAKEIEEKMKAMEQQSQASLPTAQAPAAPETSIAIKRPSQSQPAIARPVLLQRPQRSEARPEVIAQRNAGQPALQPLDQKNGPSTSSQPAIRRPMEQTAQGQAPQLARPSNLAVPLQLRPNESLSHPDNQRQEPLPVEPVSPQPIRADRPQAIAAAALKSVRPEILERSSWRRPASEQPSKGPPLPASTSPLPETRPQPSKMTQGPATTGLASAATNGSKRSSALQAPVTLANQSVVTPPGLPPPGLPPVETDQPSSVPPSPHGKNQSKDPGSSSFDDIMARIKSAMVDEHEQRKKAIPASPSKAPATSSETRARLRAPAPAPPPRPSSPPFVPGPPPAYFLATRSPTPDLPPPAWKTQLVKLPRTGRAPYSTGRPPKQYIIRAPSEFLTSWEPPLAQLNPHTLSRDEMFISQKYFRGKLVTMVKLPPTPALRWIQPEDDAAEKMPEETSTQAFGSLSTTAEQRTVVVKLPGAGPSGRSTSGAPPAETSSDLATPDSRELLPLPSAADTLPSLTRQKSPRRSQQESAVSFAKPQPLAGSDIKTSVRFLMESQLEENASKELLDEVLQTSQDALEDGEEHPMNPGIPSKLDTSTIESTTVSPQVKSGPSSPIASNAMGKRSTLYPVSQSPGRGVDKNHIKSVWSSQPDHDVGISSNSLKGIADELPQFSMPMQDLPEGKDDHESAEQSKELPNGGQEDADIPQFASVGAVKSSETVLSPGVSNGYSQYPMDPRLVGQSQSPYGPAPTSQSGQSPASSYQYPASNGMAPQYSGSAYSGTPLSAQGPSQAYMGMHRVASDSAGHMQPASGLSMHGIPGQLQHQMGVWMPASQHQNGSMPGGAGHIGAPGPYQTLQPKLGGGHSTMRPGSTPTDYRSMSHGLDPQYGAAANSMGTGIYSNASGGPLDSPVTSYARPYLGGGAPSGGTTPYGMSMGYGGGPSAGAVGYAPGQQRYGSAVGIGQRSVYGGVGSQRGQQQMQGYADGYNPAVGSAPRSSAAGYQQQLRSQLGHGGEGSSPGGGYGHMDLASKGLGSGAAVGGSRAAMGQQPQHQRHASGSGATPSGGGHRGGLMGGSSSMGGIDRRPW